MPQHDLSLDQHPVYPYNPQQARKLVKASGYHGQPITLLYSITQAWKVSEAPGIQQDLRQIGLDVTLRGVTDNTLQSMGGSFTGHQLSTGSWCMDFLDAYDVYSGEVSCSANVPGGASAAHFCDAVADRLVDKANMLPLGGKRNALLHQAQMRILESASRIPLVFLKTTDIVSPKVGGFYYNPIFGWQYENYWLKP